MRTLIFIVILAFLACKSSISGKDVSPVNKTIREKSSEIDKTKFYVTADSIIIASKYFDTMIYSKKVFNQIVDYFPILYDTIPSHPDISYVESGMFREIVNEDGTKETLSFSSEAGKDEYCILYAYFLQRQNDDKTSDKRRETIINIYRNINDIYGALKYGGTYFGHQYYRIVAYAEYGLLQYKKYSDEYDKSYDIKKQKQMYIALLRQKIMDEVSIDNEAASKDEKTKRRKMLFKYVDSLNYLITDNFYLEKAQEFQFSNY